MNRRTFVIAVTSAMLATGAFGGLVVAAEPIPAETTGGSSTRHGGASSLPDVARPSSTPTSAPTATQPPAPPAPAEPAPVPPPAPPAAAPAADPAEQDVLAITNSRRAENGCSALTWDEGLAGVARSHSGDMAARDYFSHTTPEGVDPFQRAAAAGQSASAENIAAGQPTAAAVMDGWMNSAGHRANILNCSLTRLGVGVGYGGSYGIYWTQLFG